MIELVSDSRCIRCDICVKVCPTNVFDAVPDEAPVIARKDDCQTCFMCELYCPTDALFVAPEAERSVHVGEQALVERALLGSYRAAVGWGEGRTPCAAADQSFRILGPERPRASATNAPATPERAYLQAPSSAAADRTIGGPGERSPV